MKTHGILWLAIVWSITSVASADESNSSRWRFPKGTPKTGRECGSAADLGDKPADILPLKTRLWATQDSVTGGVA